MEESVLASIGLNQSQSKAYMYLLNHGNQLAMELAEAISESRTNTYNLLDQLMTLGLVEKPSGEKHYKVAPPTALKKLLIQRSQALKRSDSELSSLLPSMMSTYRLRHVQPGVVQAEGEAALSVIYDEIIKTSQPPLIMACKHDRDRQETADIIDHQIKRQLKAGIPSRVLMDGSELSSVDSQMALKNGVEIKGNLLGDLPAQVMIYGNSVAFTTFRQGVNTVVINNDEIADSLRIVFERLWSL